MITSTIPAYKMTLDDPGDIDAPHDTASWARAMRIRLAWMMRQSETTLHHFQTYLRLLEEEKGYQHLEDSSGQPFSSLAAFCGAQPPYGLGYDPDILAAIQSETRAMLLQEKVAEFIVEANPKEGRKRKLDKLSSLTQEERARQNRVGIVTQKKLDYLAGHRPDLLCDVQRGALSVHKAYGLAKGQLPETPFDALLRSWRRVSREERVRFIREMLTEDERAEFAEELQAIETRVS